MNFNKTRSKVCTRCNIRKPISSFSKQKSKTKTKTYYYKSYCSGCQSKAYRKKNPEKIKEISDRGKQKYRAKRLEMKYELMKHINQECCKYCGFSDVRALSFHHIDTSKKEFEISYGFTHSYGMDLMKKEAEKCDVVCMNCHIILHSKPIGE